MYILKNVKHTEREKFYNIINNHYLYDDHQLKDYFSNIDYYILQKMQFFMKILANGCNNNNAQMVAIVDLLSQANKQSAKTKKKRCPNGTKRRKKNCVKTQKKKKQRKKK